MTILTAFLVSLVVIPAILFYLALGYWIWDALNLKYGGDGDDW